MTAQPSDVLRIALSMRGGVSLAVWIGGAVQELDRLAHAPLAADDLSARIGGPPFYEALLAIAGYERAVIDVITGASAGGLNGVVLAASRAYGFDFGQMLPLWVELGDIELLTRDPTARYEDPRTGRRSLRPESLMKGDEYFQARLAAQLRQLVAGGNTAESVDEPFDLILSATLVNPTYETTDEDPFAPLAEVRRSADFHFRYVGQLGADGGDFQQVGDVGGMDATSDRPESTVSLLAVAGRATSSFPVAFEPAKVTHDASRVFSDPPHKDEAPRRVLDGGVLDNIPVAKAIEAVAAVTVAGKPDRWLVFLHPSPSARTEDAANVGGLAAPGALRTMIITASTAFSQESLLDDLEELKRYNARAHEQRIRRAGLMCGIDDWNDLEGMADRSDGPSQYMRAHLDALRAVGILQGERRVRRPLREGVDQATPTAWLRAVRARLYSDVAASYERAYAAREVDPPHGAEAVVYTVPGLRLACDVVSTWLAAAEPDSATDGAQGTDGGVAAHELLDQHARRLGELRRLVQLAQNWSDQAWLVAGTYGPDPNSAWAFETADVALSSLRKVPREEFDALAAAFAADLGRGAPRGSKVDRWSRAMVDVDGRMRSLVNELAVHEGASGDLAEWLFGQLVVIVEECVAISTRPSLPPAPASSPASAREPRLRRWRWVPFWRPPLVTPPSRGPATADHHTGPASERESKQSARLLEMGLEHGVRLALYRLALVLTRTQTVEFASDDEVKFIRITGSNETPLRSKFVADGEPFGVDEKLCGNELGNFAAFFSARWRANDWMWGRLDAVKSIVDLTMRPERLHRSTLDAEQILRLVEQIADRSDVPLSTDDLQALKLEVVGAKDGTGRSGTVLLRRVLTESMQRQVFAEMRELIVQLGSLPVWPSGSWPAGKTDQRKPRRLVLDDQMRRYRVGSESISDIGSRRRTEIGMRLAMVAYSILRPAPRSVGTRALAYAMSALKPVYLFGAFGALNLSRAAFVFNMTAVGFWVGPWRYRDAGSDGVATEHVPWELFVHEKASGERWWWHPAVAPHEPGEWFGFLFIALVSVGSLVAFVRFLGKRRRAKAQHRVLPKGGLWYLSSGVLGLGALAGTSITGIVLGPILVMAGAALIAMCSSLWMRRLMWLVVFLGSAAIYTLTGLVAWWIAGSRTAGFTAQAARWYSYTGWLSVIALYATMAFIAMLCTWVRVLPANDSAGAVTSTRPGGDGSGS